MIVGDQAPLSSALARLKVLRELPDTYNECVDRMTFSTAVRKMANGNDRAVTTISRPCSGWPVARRDAFDQVVIEALAKLPGSTRFVTITMGRTYEIEWDGVRAPV